MADGVAITAGTGTTIATDDCGASGQVQVVKLAYSADGVATLITADSSGLKTQVSTSPAASRASDSVSAALGVDKLMNNLTAVTPTFASVSAASSGNNTILAAQGASNIILVHQCILVASGAVTIKFQSGAGGTDLTGAMSIAANGGFVLPFSPVGWFKTAANTLLNLSLGGAVAVNGVFTYTVVT